MIKVLRKRRAKISEAQWAIINAYREKYHVFRVKSDGLVYGRNSKKKLIKLS